MRAWTTLCAVLLLGCGGSQQPEPEPAAPAPPPQPIETVHPEKQPVEEVEEEVADDDEDDYQGDPEGVEGVAEGDLMGAEPPPPPPPPPRGVVTQAALDAQMISGEKQIVADELTKASMATDRKQRVDALLKVCVNVIGRPSSVTVIKSSGYPGYDAKLVGTIYEWRFRPFLIDGNPREVCGAHTFVYDQANKDLEINLKRVSGEDVINPDARTQEKIDAAHKRLEVVTKVCVDRAGVPTAVTTLASSGHPALDEKLRATMRKWRFEPHQVDGAAVPVCGRFFSYYGKSDVGDSGVSSDVEDEQDETPPRPRIIPPAALRANLISGETVLVPDEATRKKIALDGKTRLVLVFKICVSATGTPSRVDMVRGSDYLAYNKQIMAKMWAWRFKPYMVNGKPVEVCAAHTLIYNQKD